MEFRSMKRKELQALCKKHGVPANLTNREMADRLSSIFEETEKSVVQWKCNSDASVEPTRETDGKAVRQNVKKVRFSPVDETFVFISSNLKCTSREERANARGSSCRRSSAAEKALRRVVSVGSTQSPVRTTRSRARKVVDKDVPQVFSPGIRKKSRQGEVKVENNEIQSNDAGGVSPELSDSTDRENPQVEVAAPLQWHLRSRKVGVEKDRKVEGTTIENTTKNVRPPDAKKRNRNDTEGHLHSDNKPKQRKTTRHSKRMERGETDSKLSSEESEASQSVGRRTRSRALRVERASAVKAMNEIVEVQEEIDKVVQLPKIVGRRTRKSTAQDENPPSENDGQEGKKSDIFTARSMERRKTKRMKRNAGTGSKSLVNAEIAGIKLCSQKKSGLDASTIEAENRKSEVLEEHEEVDCLRYISNDSSQSVLRGKHSPVHMGKGRNALVLEDKTRRRTKDTCHKLRASKFEVAVDPVNGLPLRRSRRKAIPSAVLTDKEFIAHPTDRKDVRLSPYNTASEVETSAKEQSLKKLMTNTLVHNSKVSSDAPAKQKRGKASNGEMEYSEPSIEEPRTSRQCKRGTYKFKHGASMKSIVKADAQRQKGSATIAEESAARAKSGEMMDETLNIYVYLDVPAILEHEGGLEKNGKIDKAECSKNNGSDGKAGDITGVNTLDCHAVNIYRTDDPAALSGIALVSAAEKSQEVDVKCGLEELATDSVVTAEESTVLIEDDRGKVQDSVNRSCQALGRAEGSIPEQVSSRAQIEDMNAVSHQGASLTQNSDSVDESSDVPLCLENKPETEHLCIGEVAYPRSVEELGLKDHMDECGQGGIEERGPVYANEHTHQFALLDAGSNEEQNQVYEASEVRDINLGLQVGTFKTATEDVVAIQLHNSCSSAPRGTPELLALGSGEANQLKTTSSVISPLQNDGHFGGDRYTSRETEFSSERAQPEQTVIYAEDGLCTPEKTTEEPGRKQRESQEPLESVEAAVAACEVAIDKVAEGNQSADASFSLSNPIDAKITREKVREVEEGSSDIASEKPLGNFTRESSGKDLSMIPQCNTPVAKKCLLSYEHPLQKESEKQGQDAKGQCPLLEECFCTFGEEISNKPAFKSESDLSSMKVGRDNKDKIQEDFTTEEDNGVHFGTDLIHARDDDLKDKLQADCTGTCPDEPGSDTDEHRENGPMMRRFESGFDETGNSRMETISAQAVGLITSVEGSSAEDKGIPSEMVALHSPNTFDHELSSCTNDVAKDNDGYEAGGNLEDEILSPVNDGNSLSHRCLDANSEENSLEVEEKSFLSSCDMKNITRRAAKTDVLIESVLVVISSRNDQVLGMKEVMNDSSSHQLCGNLNAEKGADTDTITSRVACENFPPDESNALRSCNTSVFLQDCIQFHGDESTKIDLNATITPGVAAEDPKCNFNGVLGTMLHFDEQKIDLWDGQRGNCLRPDQKVPAILECPIPSEPISADVSIYVGTTESGLIPKDIKTDAVQFDDDKLVKRSHLDEVSSHMIEAAPNVNRLVEVVNTSHEDIIHREDEGSALVMQENPETFNLEDGSTPAVETTMSLHGMSIGYKWDKTNSVGESLVIRPCDEPNKASDSSAAPPLKVVPFPEEDPSKENNVDIGTNAKEKSEDTEEVIVQEAHEPQEDHAVFGNASGSNHSSGACREVAKEYARDDEVASAQTDPVLCETSCTKDERIVKHNEETHGPGRFDEPATEFKQLSANADSSSDFSLISSIGDPSILENKFMESQVESQTFTGWEMSFVFGDNSLDSVGKLDADAKEERQRNGNANNADNVEVRIAELEEKVPVVTVEDSKDHVDRVDAQITLLNETFLKNQENKEDMIGVTDDEHSKDEATFKYSRDLEHEKKDVTEDHCSNCPGTKELAIKNEKDSMEQEVVSAMIQEYMDREKLEDGSTEVRVSCVDSREKELAHVNAGGRAPSDICPLQHAPSELRKEHLSFSSYANENVELGIKKEKDTIIPNSAKDTIIPNSANHSPASVNLSARTDVAENVRMQQLNLISPPTKSLDVKKEELGKLVNSLMVGRTKARSNFIEKTRKKLLVTSDMKENIPSTKWEQVGSVTASKTTKARRVLEDLQRKQI